MDSDFICGFYAMKRINYKVFLVNLRYGKYTWSWYNEDRISIQRETIFVLTNRLASVPLRFLYG
jgi:hypothetical protein